MIKGALLAVDVIMVLIFMAASLWSWLKERDMQSAWMLLVITITYGLKLRISFRNYVRWRNR